MFTIESYRLIPRANYILSALSHHIPLRSMLILSSHIHFNVGMRQRRWLRNYATSRKVAGSIPDVIGFFQMT
jgi:hypothetical protein